VRAAGPATGPAHAAFKLGERLLNPDLSRLRLLAGGDPTNPLIPRERGNIVPERLHRWARINRPF